MFTVEFSVLSYHPSFLTDESINIGILFHCVQDNRRIFKPTKNWDRLTGFDDEVNIEFTKIFLSGLEESVEPSLFSQEKFDIKSFIKFYVNEFKFSKIHSVIVDDFDKFLEETSKIYLRYDYEKNKRPKKKEQLEFLKVLLDSKNVGYKKSGIKGNYNDNVKFDYIIDNHGIKFFELNENNIHFFVNQAKIWAYNSMELKDKYNTIITYTKTSDFVIEENEYFQTIKQILDNSAIHKILELDECLKFLDTLDTK